MHDHVPLRTVESVLVMQPNRSGAKQSPLRKEDLMLDQDRSHVQQLASPTADKHRIYIQNSQIS